MGSLISQYVFQPRAQRPLPESVHKDAHFIDLAGINISIPILFAATQLATARPTTLLFAHGNAEDLTLIEPMVRTLVQQLGVNVAAFEYPGYRGSAWNDGNEAPLLPSEQYVYAAAEGAFQWLQDVQKIPSTDIILYGKSLGSGPAVHLAARAAREGTACGGLILQCPLASVVRVVAPRLWFTLPFIDMFANIDKIGEVKCRTTVIHGTRDEVVPVECARQLEAAIPVAYRAPALYIEGGYHNDLDRHGTALIDHINAFIASSVSSNVAVD